MDKETLKGITGTLYYEERLLYNIFYLKYSDTSRIVYTTSTKLKECVKNYYLNHLYQIMSESDTSVKDRLKFLYLNNADEELTLSEKLLNNHNDILMEMRNYVNPDNALMSVQFPGRNENIISERISN